MEHYQQAIDQLAAYGLHVDTIEADGKLRRVPVEGDKGRKKSGWYVAHEFNLMNGRTVITGRFGNWKLSGDTQSFEADFKFSPEDKKVLQKKQAEDRKRVEAERKRAAKDAAKRAAELWEKTRDTGNSGYLKRKQVRGFYIGYMRDAILVPLRTITGQLVGLQFIYEDGSKKFLTGTAKLGAFHVIGDIDNADQVIIAEGYATAASIFEATQIPCVIAFDTGNLLPVAQAWRKRKPDLKIIFAADDDHATDGNPGITKATAAAAVVRGVIIKPRFKDPVGRTDFNDMSNEQGLPLLKQFILDAIDSAEMPEAPSTPQPATPAQIEYEPPADEWQRNIQRTKDGAPIANLANVYLHLSNLKEWKGVIARDDFANRIVCEQPPPFGGNGNRPWTDNDDSRAGVWLSMFASCSPKTPMVLEAVQLVAQDNAYHRVREYLNDIKWDGKPRVGSWLIDYMGALHDIDEDCSQGEVEEHEQLERYLQAAGVKWLVSAVARVMRPGCKTDCVLILEGAQGVGKSTALSILGGEWFSDTPFTLGDKDSYQQLSGKWIIEMPELDSFNKTENTKAKAFFSGTVDTYRPSYGRRAEDFPRQCVFAGTTNQHEYLRDTSNRRYWPVYCNSIDLDGLKEERDQLWAEALQMFSDGVKWWPLPHELKLFEQEQSKRQINDPWYDKISDWLDDPERREGGTAPVEVTTNLILEKCLGVEIGKAGERIERIRIGTILHRLGWVRRQRSRLKDRYYYVRGRDA